MSPAVPMAELGPSTLLHRECGRPLERINAYIRGPANPVPGLMCWHCLRWVPLDVLTNFIAKHGRWSSLGS